VTYHEDSALGWEELLVAACFVAGGLLAVWWAEVVRRGR
jgi:hypothetical protein